MTWFYKRLPTGRSITREKEQNPKWQIFGYGDCEWTKKTLEMLKKHNEKNIEYKDVLEDNLSNSLIQNGYTRVPIIFRNDELLGSYNDLIQYYQSTPIDTDRK